MQGRMLAYWPKVLRTVTFMLLKPPPCGVVIGAFRKTLVRRSESQADGSMPARWPRLYTASPISMVSISIWAPAAWMMASVACMISGPIPSPWATVMGVLEVIWGSLSECAGGRL